MRWQGITRGLNKRQVAGPVDDRRVDVKGFQRHRVGLAFVVKGKTRACVTQRVNLRREMQAETQACGRLLGTRVRCGKVQRLCPPTQAFWQSQTQGLRHVNRGFVVHVFVLQHQAPEIQGFVVHPARCVLQDLQVGQTALQHLRQIGLRPGQIGQRQSPAAVVRDFAGVVKGIGIGQQRGIKALAAAGTARAPMALVVAHRPPLLKPSDMTPLPQRGVHAGQGRDRQIGQSVLPGLNQAQRARSGALQAQGQSRRAGCAHRTVNRAPAA